MNFSLFDHDELVALIKYDMRNDKYDCALEKLKNVLVFKDCPIDTFSIAGKIYANLGLFEKAGAYFERYLELVPDAINELFEYGMVQRDSGNVSECKEIWLKVLQLNENYPEALFYLGETYFWENKNDAARDLLYRLLETAPDNSRYIALTDELLNRINAN